MFHKLNYDLIKEIVKFIIHPKWVLRNTIPENQLHIRLLSTNKNSFDFLMNHIDYIDSYSFSRQTSNKYVLYLLRYPNLIDYSAFSFNINPLAIDHMIKNSNLINWVLFCSLENDEAVLFMIQNESKIN